MSALIIDDDHDLSMLLKTILTSQIPEVECALTIKSGKEKLKEMNPDIIFLDNNLPDGLGVNNIADIKSIAPNAALIMITAMGNSREEALMRGADIFLEKPLTSSNIREVLHKISQRQDTQA